MSLLSCVVCIVLAYQGRRSECQEKNEHEWKATDFHVRRLGFGGECSKILGDSDSASSFHLEIAYKNCIGIFH